MSTIFEQYGLVPTFDNWWDLYDYKLDRRRCERLWHKMSARDKQLAMEHTQRYADSTYTDGRFPSRRHPGTYLHNHNWHDEALIRKPSSARDKVQGILDAVARQSEGHGHDPSGGHQP